MDMLSVLANIAKEAEPAIMTIQGVAGIIALFLFGSALIDLWAAGNASSQKFLAGSQRSTYMGACVQMFIAIMFLAIADLKLIGIATRSFTGNYAAQRMMSSSLSYDPGASTSMQAQFAVFAIVAIMQIVGIIAIMKGLFVINGRANGRSQDSYGKGISFLIGGLGCWNMHYVSWIINHTIGFNLFGLFSLTGSSSPSGP